MTICSRCFPNCTLPAGFPSLSEEESEVRKFKSRCTHCLRAATDDIKVCVRIPSESFSTVNTHVKWTEIRSSALAPKQRAESHVNRSRAAGEDDSTFAASKSVGIG
jgi:hypothetical protein